jgi:hypothetical protein
MWIFYAKVKSIKLGKVMANALILGELFPFGQKLNKN